MTADDFYIDMSLDQNGVLIQRYIGLFSFDAWKAAREAALAKSGFADRLAGRRSVILLTLCRPPLKDWNNELGQAMRYLADQNQQPSRRALVVEPDSDIGLVAKFVTVIEEAIQSSSRTRLFDNMEEAYAWATEDWSNGETQDTAD